MTSSQPVVVVEQVPERWDARRAQQFLGQIEHRMATLVRPAVVLDCARVGKVDRPLILLLLSCLEEALKRNGDVRLAGIRPELWNSLEALGLGRLFQAFPSLAEAVNSYSRLAAGRRTTISPDQAAANAA